ncbi:hypothetical protein [Rhizobium etli]|uniref:hypothetical protein n=1 Tax=Rhizobium etli TaxID=29449 RepID=UPI000383953C|nr:hypothetical protein [Rhizobium etli]AGS25472.1 hypothetical protein REMIM1_PE00386 [Rhizobium etli bv. mimosae str. Mim1]
MASPWEFLARLVSPGRGRKRENGSTDIATPDALAIAAPTGTHAEESVNGADRPAREERRDQSAAISAETVRSETAVRDDRDEADREDARIVEAADPALSGGTGIDVTAAHDATEVNRDVEVVSHKRRSRGKAVAIGNVSEVCQVIHTADEVNLDEEIMVLRSQLAGKLRLQNAQLRKRLERFDRRSIATLCPSEQD